MDRSRKTGFIEVVERIRSELGRFDYGILPSIRSLAERYDSSAGTIRKALKKLEMEGLVQCVRGRRCRVTGTGTLARSLTSLRLADLLEKDLADGNVRAGEPMPKLEAIVLEHHVSRATAHQALVELERRDVCHRIGGRRIAGSKPKSEPTLLIHSLPVVLILARTHSSYTHLFRSERTLDFMVGFHSELEKKGARTALGLWGSREGGLVECDRGLVPIDELIGLHGKQYAGSAVLGKVADTFRAHAVRDTALRFGKPVLQLITDTPGMEDSVPTNLQKNYFRCFHDEQAAAGLAIETLFSLGHRVIGIPNLYEEYRPWVAQRIRTVERLIDKQQLDMEIVEMNEPRVLGKLSESERLVQDLIRRCRTWAPSLAQALVNAYRSHGTLLQRSGLAALAALSVGSRKKKFTAILTPNDQIADGIYRWVRYKNLRVPQELSILSFDNNFKYRHVPISTVDFGMNHQGYAAAQLFLQQVPVPVTTNRAIRSRCHIVHRGSLGVSTGK